MTMFLFTNVIRGLTLTLVFVAQNGMKGIALVLNRPERSAVPVMEEKASVDYFACTSFVSINMFSCQNACCVHPEGTAGETRKPLV